MPAIISTLKHSVSKMGVRGTISNLTKVNKFSGFDCPGCAWPDPDYKRTMAEFCENGAKAIADEGTLKGRTQISGHRTRLLSYQKNLTNGSIAKVG